MTTTDDYDEPTVDGVLGLLADVIDLLDGAAVQLAELLGVERERRSEALDAVWQAWAYADRARALLAPVPST